ncbi:chromate transporter-domain-containing protein [Aspergillus multicolor]|uniref:chromate transporter-domain-containing protein n=1 Tax=Aspergillus multicolor TaxID=41759 RepID=UPI003CCC9EE4
MPLSAYSNILSSLRSLSAHWRRTLPSPSPSTTPFPTNPSASASLKARLLDTLPQTWDLGLTAFGGPPVHFQILHARFVEREKWVDEETYQELFAICQGLPGPASTKMLFCLALLRGGSVPAVVVFGFWCLPGALGMYFLSLGVQHINETLPSAVYALLSGLNASTVGIIALAAVQLAEKAIRDKISRILVIFGACAGLLYNTLWYFPLLMVLGGLGTVFWDGWGGRWVRAVRRRWRSRRNGNGAHGPADGGEGGDIERVGARTEAEAEAESVRMRRPRASIDAVSAHPAAAASTSTEAGNTSETQVSLNQNQNQNHIIRVRIGITILILFFASFITLLTIRARLSNPPLPLSLFSNLYLAGTVIFGGGPVVIPLLRSYVVDPGWVSSRDFLIGLALIQSFPGPNFNFAVFLGALTLSNSDSSTSNSNPAARGVLGAILAGLAIFTPGLTLAVSVQSFWRVLRRRMYVLHFLRGVNAAAVGLVFTAVYRLWEIGYLVPGGAGGEGISLASEPWWVVVAAVSFSSARWFGVPPALAILGGAVLGVVWWGVVRVDS